MQEFKRNQYVLILRSTCSKCCSLSIFHKVYVCNKKMGTSIILRPNYTKRLIYTLKPGLEGAPKRGYFKRGLHPEVQSLTLSYYTLARNNTLSLIKKTVKMIQFHIAIIFGNPFIYCNAMFRFPSICHK